MPNLTDFATFLYTVVGIPSVALPSNSPYITTAFNVAMAICSPDIGTMSAEMYPYAVYNLGADRLINFCPDQAGQTYFQTLRSQNGLNLMSFVAGPIESSSDESTSQSIAVQESLKNLTLLDLQMLKTPYGRVYLGLAQQIGTLWGGPT